MIVTERLDAGVTMVAFGERGTYGTATFLINCSTLDTTNSKRGIKVSKGKQYWVVAKTDSTNEDSENAWDFVYNSAAGPVAYDINDTGSTGERVSMAAFAVYGH